MSPIYVVLRLRFCSREGHRPALSAICIAHEPAHPVRQTCHFDWHHRVQITIKHNMNACVGADVISNGYEGNVWERIPHGK